MCSQPPTTKACLLFFLVLFFLPLFAIRLSPQQAQQIGKKIWKNECAGTVKGLTSWNKGEEFASLGIGHFIWCPKSKKACPFSESFPLYIHFVKTQHKKIPSWLKTQMHCPWKNRDQFLKELQGKRMQELRQLLVDTVDLQTTFIVQRLEAALPKMIINLPTKKRSHIKAQFHRLEQTSNGLYALIDYVNFKGEGIKTNERYKNKGWGLLQVLESMKGKEIKAAVPEFVAAAKELLTQRVHNAPKNRHEEQWLTGWKNRLDTYIM